MAAISRPRRLGIFAAFAITAAAIGGVASSPANAGSEPYLGWDFGHGLGVGIGTPPSAYDPCPTYGWPASPYRCHYRAVHYDRNYASHHRYRYR